MNRVGWSSRLMRLSALVLGTVVVLGSGRGGAGTLEDAVRTATSTNPDVRARAADRRAVDHELRRARAGYLPSVDLRVGHGFEFTDDPRTRSDAYILANRRDDVWLRRSEGSLVLRQLLFDGFATDSDVERNKARVDSAAGRVRDSAENLALGATRAYLETLRWQELIRIAEDNVKAHERTLADVRRLATGGRGNIGDVKQAESRVAAARAAHVQVDGILADTEANYIRVVGEPPTDLKRPTIADSALPVSRDASVDMALNDSFGVSTAKSDLAAAAAEREAAKAPFWPRFDLELGSQYNNNIDGAPGREQDFTALLVMRYRLYSGGADSARRAEFVERFAAAHESLQVVNRRVAEDARVSWNAMATARGRVKRLAEKVEADQGVIDAYREQFLVGRRDLLDLLDAHNELFISRSDLVTEEYTALLSAYRVLASGGRLLATLGIEQPSEGTTPAAKPLLGQPVLE